MCPVNPEQVERRREQKRKSDAKHREEKRLRSRAYALKNKKKVAAKNAAWRQRTIERRREIEREYRNKNREEINKRVAAWCRDNPDRRRASRKESYARRRAAAKLAAIGKDRDAYRAFLRRLQSVERIACYWCGASTRKGKRHADHIVPLAKGGKDDVHNICCACASCNMKKSDKSPEEFSGQFHLAF